MGNRTGKRSLPLIGAAAAVAGIVLMRPVQQLIRLSISPGQDQVVGRGQLLQQSNDTPAPGLGPAAANPNAMKSFPGSRGLPHQVADDTGRAVPEPGLGSETFHRPVNGLDPQQVASTEKPKIAAPPLLGGSVDRVPPHRSTKSTDTVDTGSQTAPVPNGTDHTPQRADAGDRAVSSGKTGVPEGAGQKSSTGAGKVADAGNEQLDKAAAAAAAENRGAKPSQHTDTKPADATDAPAHDTSTDASPSSAKTNQTADAGSAKTMDSTGGTGGEPASTDKSSSGTDGTTADASEVPVVRVVSGSMDFDPANAHARASGEVFLPRSASLSADVELSAPATSISIWAHADKGGGQWPTVNVMVDGEPMGEVLVNSTQEKKFYLPIYADPGHVSIQLSFTNDYYDPQTKQDRNVYIRQVKIHTEPAN